LDVPDAITAGREACELLVDPADGVWLADFARKVQSTFKLALCFCVVRASYLSFAQGIAHQAV
jgi:hypothetical protein